MHLTFDIIDMKKLNKIASVSVTGNDKVISKIKEIIGKEFVKDDVELK